MADNFPAPPDPAGYPVVVDDDGSLTVGTPFNKAYHDAVRASIADNVYSVTNPLVKTKTIIDEVVAGRGASASLDARMDAIDALITAISSPILARLPASLASTLAAENGFTYATLAGILGTDRQSLEIIAAGAFANNANNKTLKLYVGTNVLNLIVDNAALANNVFTLHGFLTRLSVNSSVFDGVATFHAASGAPPTVWHFSAVPAGGATNFAVSQDIKIFMLAPTADADITLGRCVIRYMP